MENRHQISVFPLHVKLGDSIYQFYFTLKSDEPHSTKAACERHNLTKIITLPWPGGTYLGREYLPWRGIPALVKGRYPPPSRETEQHSKYLLRGGRYASCVHAGEPSCCKYVIQVVISTAWCIEIFEQVSIGMLTRAHDSYMYLLKKKTNILKY